MKRTLTLLAAAGAITLAAASLAFAGAPELMNYQGQLDSAGSPVTNSVDMEFKIYDAASGGTELWSETQSSVSVQSGLFNVLLGSVNPLSDAVFNSTTRYLGVAVDGGTEMTPRTQIVSVGYAYRVSTVDGASGGIISGDVSIQVDLTVSGKATIGPGNSNTGANAFVAGSNNEASGLSSTVGGGARSTASGGSSIISGGSDNVASGNWSTISGGLDNITSGLHSAVSGGQLNTADGNSSIVGGGGANHASGSHSTVGGGLFDTASGHRATVAGGEDNTASGSRATVSGGSDNLASGQASNVAGGQSNTAEGFNSSVGGGVQNQVSGDYSVIAGGWKNYVSGSVSAILGGQNDTITASADSSFLFGMGSKLTQSNTFMVDMPHIRFGDESSGYEFPTSDGTADQVMSTDGSGQLSWVNPFSGANDSDWTISGNDMYSALSGNVGIGTTSPVVPLHLYRNGVTSIQLQLEQNSATAATKMRFINNAATHGFNLGQDAAPQNFAFSISNASSPFTRYFAIDTTGKVGIGTINPPTVLTVESDGSSLHLRTPGSGGTVPSLHFRNQLTLADWVLKHDETTFHIQTETAAGNEVMTLRDNGTVGIGTTSPVSPLHLYRNGVTSVQLQLEQESASAGTFMRFTNNAATHGFNIGQDTGPQKFSFTIGTSESPFTRYFAIDTTGNVGIGTTSPSTKLHVNGALKVSNASGDASVALPAGAISSSEMFDEPGVTQDIAIASLFLSGGYENILSETIQCPSSGYVLAIASCEMCVGHTSGSGTSSIEYGVSDVSASLDLDQRKNVSVPSGSSSGTHCSIVSAQKAFSVSAGTHTFYVVANRGSASTCYIQSHTLTLLFIPTAYGTVTE